MHALRKAYNCTEGEQTEGSTAGDVEKERRRTREEREGEGKERGWWVAREEGKTALHMFYYEVS